MLSLLAMIDALQQRLSRWAMMRAVGWWGAVVLGDDARAVHGRCTRAEYGNQLALAAVWHLKRSRSFGPRTSIFLPLRSKPERSAIARQIEAQLPELRDRLTSAVIFLEEKQRSQNAKTGIYDSSQLRERVILENRGRSVRSEISGSFSLPDHSDERC
jgi:hypothetical protein